MHKLMTAVCFVCVTVCSVCVTSVLCVRYPCFRYCVLANSRCSFIACWLVKAEKPMQPFSAAHNCGIGMYRLASVEPCTHVGGGSTAHL